MRRVGAIVTLAIAATGCEQFLGFTHIDRPPPDAAIDAPDAPPPPNAWAKLAGGNQHTCGLHVDGALYCWGRNDYGQFGSATPLEADAPLRVGSDLWIDVDAFDNNACGIKMDGTAWCWGDNQFGQLGTGNSTPVAGMAQIQTGISGQTWTHIATGHDFGCAIDSNMAAYCWGRDDEGQIGDGLKIPGSTLSPTQVAGTWQTISAGGQFACAIDTNQHVACWGDNTYNQCGVASSSFNPATPMPITSDTFSTVAAGGDFTCAINTSGHLRCWGDSFEGRLGNGSSTNTPVPQPVGNDTAGWTKVAAGLSHACAVQSMDGSLQCWGSNHYDQLAMVTVGDFAGTPAVVAGGAAPWLDVGAGDNATCAIASADHTMYCAGRGGAGQLGTGVPGSHTSPAAVGSSTWATVASGFDITCGLSGSQLSCWGDNEYGSVGDGTIFDRMQPVALSPGWSSVSGVAVGDHVCALDNANHVWCWGYNENHAVEGPGPQKVPSPVQPSTFNGFVFAHVAASRHTCLASSTALLCWGQNDAGQAGSGANPKDPSTSGLGAVNAVAVGWSHTCVIPSSGGGIQCLGYNDYGQLGDNNTGTSSSSLVTAAGISGFTFTKVTTGRYFSCGLSSGRVWCWGDNAHGELGDQTTSQHATPHEIMLPVAQSGWLDISAGFEFACGIDGQHHLMCWGANEHGQLASGNFMELHAPTIIGTDVDWLSVSAGEAHACALKTSGAMYCWGRNEDGQLGDGTAWTPALQIVH